MPARIRRWSPILQIALMLVLFPVADTAFAQKRGSTLRTYIWDSPPSASILEEATASTVFPFMPVFNNLAVFDPDKLTASLDTIIPELARSWSWDETRTKITFKLEEHIKWHDGKPFTARDVKCTYDLVAGLVLLIHLAFDPKGAPTGAQHRCCSERLVVSLEPCTAKFMQRDQTQSECPVCLRSFLVQGCALTVVFGLIFLNQ